MAKYLVNIDLANNSLLNAALHPSGSAPSNPVVGQVYFNTGNDTLYICTDAAGPVWDPIASDDNYADSLSLVGDTLTIGRTGSLADLTQSLAAYDTEWTLSDGTNTSTVGDATTVTLAGGAMITTSNAIGNFVTIAHDTVSRSNTTSASSPAHGGTFDVIDSIVSTQTGHITAVNTKTVTLPSVTSYSFFISDGSTTDTITNGNTLEFNGQNGITTTVNPTPLGPDYVRISHDSVSRSNTTSSVSGSHGGNFTVVDSITSNAQGHITAVNTKTVTLPTDNNTDTLQSISADSSNNDRFITTVANASGAQTGYSHSNLKYNPSTETLTVSNLIVSGTSTTVNTETINLADNIITLNSNEAGTPSQNAGIEVERGTATNVKLYWDEGDDDWQFEAANHAATPVVTTYKIPTSYVSAIGGSTSIAVTHNLGTRNVIVQLYDASTYETVYADVTRTSTNVVTVGFASAPSAASIVCTIIAVEGVQNLPV
jgi:hypothetical protein